MLHIFPKAPIFSIHFEEKSSKFTMMYGCFVTQLNVTSTHTVSKMNIQYHLNSEPEALEKYSTYYTDRGFFTLQATPNRFFKIHLGQTPRSYFFKQDPAPHQVYTLKDLNLPIIFYLYSLIWMTPHFSLST